MAVAPVPTCSRPFAPGPYHEAEQVGFQSDWELSLPVDLRTGRLMTPRIEAAIRPPPRLLPLLLGRQGTPTLQPGRQPLTKGIGIEEAHIDARKIVVLLWISGCRCVGPQESTAPPAHDPVPLPAPLVSRGFKKCTPLPVGHRPLRDPELGQINRLLGMERPAVLESFVTFLRAVEKRAGRDVCEVRRKDRRF